jgi:predicted permease
MDTLLQDIRFALRGIVKAPSFAIVAVLTLALGIGVNSSIFSVVNAVLLRPLAIDAPEELVDIYGRTATSSDHGTSSYPNYLDYREQTSTLTDVIGYSNFFANLSIDGSSELVVGELVTDGYFSTLGVRPALGRAFLSEEYETAGARPVAVVSHGFWQRRLGGGPDALERTVRLNGVQYDIVGVAPEDFGGMFPALTAQMWIPAAMVEEVDPLGNQRASGPSTGDTRLERRGQHWLWLKGRLAPGATTEQARAELEAIAGRLSEQYPETNALERLTVLATNDVGIHPDFDQTVGPAGLLLLGAVGLVLLVACGNLANMLLARASGRRREIAIRVAIGASGRRVMRQLVTESMLLALAGGALAIALASGFATVVSRIQPPLPIDLGLDVSPDWRVLAYTLALAIGTGLVFGSVPAWRASRPNLVPALKDTGEGGGSPGSPFELRDALVVGQVALSLVLLMGGALLARSLSVADTVEYGYDVERTAHLGLVMEMNGYEGSAAEEFIAAGQERLEALPEVESVGLTSRVPLSLNNNGFGIFIDGHQRSGDDRPYVTDGAYVDEGYFDALDLRIVVGRGIESSDRAPGQRVSVVTQAMAERYWPGEDVVGREFRTSWEGAPYRIVGVVEDHKVDTPGEAPTPYIHLPLPRQAQFVNYLVRTSVDVAGLLPTLEGELRALDPDLVFLDTGTMRELGDVRLFPIRAGAWLISLFGALALTLSAVGIYGVMGYAVNRRMRELGIRKALGSDDGQIVRLVVRRAGTLIAIGGALGALLAAAAGRLLASALFVSPFDTTSFVVAISVLTAASLGATLVPAWRAARVDPIRVLRSV